MLIMLIMACVFNRWVSTRMNVCHVIWERRPICSVYLCTVMTAGLIYLLSDEARCWFYLSASTFNQYDQLGCGAAFPRADAADWRRRGHVTRGFTVQYGNRVSETQRSKPKEGTLVHSYSHTHKPEHKTSTVTHRWVQPILPGQVCSFQGCITAELTCQTVSLESCPGVLMKRTANAMSTKFAQNPFVFIEVSVIDPPWETLISHRFCVSNSWPNIYLPALEFLKQNSKSINQLLDAGQIFQLLRQYFQNIYLHLNFSLLSPFHFWEKSFWNCFVNKRLNYM